MSVRSDMKDNTYSASISTTDSSAESTEHPYQGFDRNAEDKVRDLARTITSQSIHENAEENQSIYSTMEGINPVFSTVDKPGYNEKLDPTSDMFSSVDWVKNMSKLATSDPEYYKPYSLGCVWKDLTAAGENSDVAYQATVINMPQKIVSAGYSMINPPKEEDLFQILKPMHGYLDPGELMVVLGRPGSGCTTFLKSISSNTHGFKVGKDSVISYSGLTPKDIKKHYRGEVVYNAEADIHLPHLTVFQTLYTVARLKTPQK